MHGYARVKKLEKVAVRSGADSEMEQHILVRGMIQASAGRKTGTQRGYHTMKTYALTDTCPEPAIVQHLELSDHDYSDYASLEAAISAEVDALFDADPRYFSDRNDARRSVSKTIVSYTREEVLEAARDDYGWPLHLGFVKEVEEDEDFESTSETVYAVALLWKEDGDTRELGSGSGATSADAKEEAISNAETFLADCHHSGQIEDGDSTTRSTSVRSASMGARSAL
jgi:hypothetical protein